MEDADALALRSELAKKELELRQLQESFDEYTQSSQELEQELEQELARAEQQTKQLSAKAAWLERELDSTRDTLDATQHEMRKCETELNALRSELTRVSAVKRQLEQEQDELTTQVRILQATEEDLRHKMEREMEEKVFLLSDQEELKREHELITERLRTEIVDLKSELFAVQLQNETLQAENQQHHKTYQDELDARKAQQLQEHDQQVMKSSSAHSSNASDRMDLDDDSALLPPRLSTLQERDQSDREQLIETLQQELDVLSVRLQEEIELRERLEMDYLDAHDHLAQAEAMENEMAEMSDELIEKSQEIRQRDLEIQSLHETVHSLKVENAALREENAELKAAVETHLEKRALPDSSEMIRSLRSQCLELEEAESQLREKLQEEQQLTAQLRVENDDLARQVDENARLRKHLEEELDVQVQKKKHELSELKELNGTLRRQLDSATRKAADLEEKASAVSLSSASSSTSSSSTDTKSTRSIVSTDTDSRRQLIEIQALRANISLLQAENARLRNEDNAASALLPNKRVSTDLLKINYTPEQLATKYLEERTRNAALLSRLQTVCGNIQVFCRVRPVIGEELAKCYGSRLGVNVINQADVAALDVRADRVFPYGADGNQPPDADTGDLEMLDVNAAWKVFTFDRVLGPAETQVDVFREVEPIAQSVVEGFKACIFAYGQTGSGKTYTMEGTDSDPGLNYRVISHIFQSIVLRGAIYDPDRVEEADMEAAELDGDDPPKQELCYHIQIGVLEIYNETLRDLVNPSNRKALEIRQDPTTGDIVVPELTMATAATPEQTISILRAAQANRVTGKTDVHEYSSRSHSVVILQISTRTCPDPSNQSDSSELMDSYVSGKLYMVDLAGSERVKKSNVTGDMLKEASAINTSLSALAAVMEALDKKLPHVPYRNSKLTYLLQDVLNTSCKTVMIVNCGPTIESASETFRSLQLAERVRNIVVGRNSIVKNKKDILSGKRAFSEIQSLKQQLQAKTRQTKQYQQTIVTMKREQKNQSDQNAVSLQARLKTAETQAGTLRTQYETAKSMLAELTEQLKHEHDAKQKESDLREQAQRQLRQLTTKTRVSTSHVESLEKQLKDREDEIKKLRHLLTEARQRTATAVIPRHKSVSLPGPVKKPRHEEALVVVAEPEDNQEEEDEVFEECQPAESVPEPILPPKSVPSAAVTKIPMPKFGFNRQKSAGGAVSGNKKAFSTGKSDIGSAKLRRSTASTSVASTGGASSSVLRPGWK